jgi:PAT family beta-lactamase induction signal transducer AmpG
MEKKHSLKDLLTALKKKRFFVVFILGMSAGLPIMLVASALKIWLRREGIELSTVGFISWLMVPYSFNFLWAPLLDNFFVQKFGRRRSWILFGQLGIGLSLFLISISSPTASLTFLVLSGVLMAFFSATQDVAIDAYRREIMDDEEQGIGAALYVYGYRLAMLYANGFGVWIVDKETWDWSFNQMFLLMAITAIVLSAITFFADEPRAESHEGEKSLHTMVVLPFKEFLTRKMAFTILFFIFLFKFGDGVASSMYSTYYVDLGYTNKVIAEVTKVFGSVSGFVGLAVGASIVYMVGIFRSLILFGVFQALSTAAFALLPILGKGLIPLGVVVFFEDFSSALGTIAMVSFMSVMADKRFTATQYALLASLAAMGRTIFSGFAGALIEWIQGFYAVPEEALIPSYQYFFVICGVIAIPGLLLALRIIKNEDSMKEHY